ncbi:proline-rich family protein [Abeliophyllum distichum]|uniref:Proline-rich family protein n=1 Tax=Abeliophyllum distichum TaxID=126358 RepID=A0ABD1RTZ1_9LAMI
MASALSGNSCTVTSSRLVFNRYRNEPKKRQSLHLFKVRASAQDSDCNTEECAPDKEVGKVSMEWVAGDNTKVAGTFPPRNRGWTGFVEKDTAGQTNIYSVEPAVYVAESAISSGNRGSSADGSENTAAITAGIALISIAAASSVLLQVGRNPPVIQTAEYSGPSLSYYITKFMPPEIAEATVPTVTETSSSLQTENSAPEVSQAEVQLESQQDMSASNSNIS